VLDFKENKQFLFNIIVPVFNAEKYLAKCLNSIIKQSYKKFKVQVIDDCSTDSSYELASAICAKYENFHIKKNYRRLGALNNIYELLSLGTIDPSKTIDILIDGDDYLYSGDVLNILHEKYLNTNCLITYGSFLSSKGFQGKGYPLLIIKFNLYRKYFWYASHLKTFRHDLWLSVNRNDLIDQNGQYFSVAWDLALMFPMLEMAGDRQAFVKDLLYVYNDQNPISDHKIRRREQISAAKEIRNKKRYKVRNFI
tara:strand:- start:661 stop:1419 length:759 start_codon:yes stop_codon:yes gene_type:complete